MTQRSKQTLNPTKKQRELLTYIDQFIKENGYGPSYREIMRALEYKSVSTVATHVDGLISRGYLQKRDNSARSLEVVGSKGRPEAPISTAISTTEREIRTKIKSLSREKLAHEDEIKTLEHALTILGYANHADNSNI